MAERPRSSAEKARKSAEEINSSFQTDRSSQSLLTKHTVRSGGSQLYETKSLTPAILHPAV